MELNLHYNRDKQNFELNPIEPKRRPEKVALTSWEQISGTLHCKLPALTTTTNPFMRSTHRNRPDDCNLKRRRLFRILFLCFVNLRVSKRKGKKRKSNDHFDCRIVLTFLCCLCFYFTIARLFHICKKNKSNVINGFGLLWSKSPYRRGS